MNKYYFLLGFIFVIGSISRAQPLSEIANNIQQNNSNDSLRVAATFQWITDNISYDTQAFKKEEKRINKNVGDVLKRRKAVCHGYAQLFHALCQKMEIPSAMVDGYTKIRDASEKTFDDIDHAWNAVQINDKWYLLDATWADEDKDIYEEWFLTKPEVFIETHYPVVPMWQLMEAYWSTDDFIKGNHQSESILFSYKDSIALYFNLPKEQRKLYGAKQAHRFYPSLIHKKLLAQEYVDYAVALENSSEPFLNDEHIDTLLIIQNKMFTALENARNLYPLFDWQNELLANTHVNYGVALSRKWRNINNSAKEKEILKQITQHIQRGKKLLESLPSNFMRTQRISQCESYLEWVKSLE